MFPVAARSHWCMSCCKCQLVNPLTTSNMLFPLHIIIQLELVLLSLWTMQHGIPIQCLRCAPQNVSLKHCPPPWPPDPGFDQGLLADSLITKIIRKTILYFLHPVRFTAIPHISIQAFWSANYISTANATGDTVQQFIHGCLIFSNDWHMQQMRAVLSASWRARRSVWLHWWRYNI